MVSNTLANAGVTLTPAKPTVTVPAKGKATVEMTLAIDPAKVQLPSIPPRRRRLRAGRGTSRTRRRGRFGFTASRARCMCRTTCCCVRWGIIGWRPGAWRFGNGRAWRRSRCPWSGPTRTAPRWCRCFSLATKVPRAATATANGRRVICASVGAASNAPDLGGIDEATLFFGIAMDGPWIVPQSFLTNIGIDVDTNLDGDHRLRVDSRLLR